MPVPRSGFPGPKHGGSEARSNRRCEKISFQQKCRISKYNKQNRIEHSAKSLGENTKHINFYASFLLLSSCLLKKPSFATSACRKGPHPSTSFCGHQPKLSLKGWGIAVTEIHFKIVPIYHLGCNKTSVNNEISTTNLNWLATAGCLPSHPTVSIGINSCGSLQPFNKQTLWAFFLWPYFFPAIPQGVWTSPWKRCPWFPRTNCFGLNFFFAMSPSVVG